jgi:hypothetical protein
MYGHVSKHKRKVKHKLAVLYEPGSVPKHLRGRPDFGRSPGLFVFGPEWQSYLHWPDRSLPKIERERWLKMNESGLQLRLSKGSNHIFALFCSFIHAFGALIHTNIVTGSRRIGCGLNLCHAAGNYSQANDNHITDCKSAPSLKQLRTIHARPPSQGGSKKPLNQTGKGFWGFETVAIVVVSMTPVNRIRYFDHFYL